MTPSSDTAGLSAVLATGYDHARESAFLRTSDGEALTYSELEARADRFAGAFAALGVVPGDRVVASTAKSSDAVALYIACLRLGAVYVPVNAALTPTERGYFIDDAEPAVVVIDPQARPAEGVLTLTLGTDGTGSLIDAAREAEPLGRPISRRGDDVAAMLYTSGTTGRSKGAMLTNAALAANARALHQAWGFGPDDVLLHPLPIFHAHGLFVALHCAMLSGCEVRFLPRFSVDSVIAELPGCTVMMAVPTMYSRLMADDRFDRDLCDHMRLFTSGSAPMTAAMHTELRGRIGHHILERYGMTEAGMITTNPLDGERIAGTVGFALPDYDVRVATADGPCEVGETGVVEVRGPHLFAGYWRQPEKTAREFRDDGFFITGDVGTLDAQGRLTLQGRSSDMIISGGENIYPKEIELCLDACAGVVESAVVGQDDPDLGESVLAFVVVDDEFALDIVEEWAAARLARFKRPNAYVVIEELPRNALGKVQKNVLRSGPRDRHPE